MKTLLDFGPILHKCPDGVTRPASVKIIMPDQDSTVTDALVANNEAHCHFCNVDFSLENKRGGK